MGAMQVVFYRRKAKPSFLKSQTETKAKPKPKKSCDYFRQSFENRNNDNVFMPH